MSYFTGEMQSGDLDPYERVVKMATLIGLGTDMEESGLIRNDDDRKQWRRLARQIAAMNREGIMMTYSVPDDDVE